MYDLCVLFLILFLGLQRIFKTIKKPGISAFDEYDFQGFLEQAHGSWINDFKQLLIRYLSRPTFSEEMSASGKLLIR